MTLEKKKTASGAKARQRPDTEDRSLVYRDWRREVVGKGKGRSTCYTSDIDQIEYVIVNNQVVPTVLLELTRYDFDEYDGPSQNWEKYLAAILDRYFLRDAQGIFVKAVSQKMDIPAFIVLFRNDMESFWLFDVNDKDALWVHKSPDEYKEWLCEFKTKAKGEQE